jgi:glycosyltransferase involved in cell wall biosynthesis
VACQFLASFDALIVNSSAESAELQRLLPAHPPIHLVHCGVDALYWSEDRRRWAVERKALFPGSYHPTEPSTVPDAVSDPRHANRSPARQGVLCVARFDPQKGQHRLIQALRPLHVPLTLAGPDNPNHPRYRGLCQKLAGPEVTFLPRQGPEQLQCLYRQCQVHALCSWYETTGLTGLEAGSCGARVVMTARGGTHDYGGDLAWYADPADLGSIRQTIQQALAAASTPDLRSHVARQFTWEKSARTLLRAYEAVLARPAARRLAA